MFDSNSLHCSNEKQESKMDSYYFKWWRLFQLLLSGNACPAFGATPHRRAHRLVAASSVIRLIRFVAPPLPNTRGVSGTPNLIYALPQNSSQDCFDLRDALTLISRHGRLRFQYSLTLLVIIKITGTPKRCPCYFNMVETIGIEPMTPCTSSRYSNQLS